MHEALGDNLAQSCNHQRATHCQHVSSKTRSCRLKCLHRRFVSSSVFSWSNAHLHLHNVHFGFGTSSMEQREKTSLNQRKYEKFCSDKTEREMKRPFSAAERFHRGQRWALAATFNCCNVPERHVERLAAAGDGSLSAGRRRGPSTRLGGRLRSARG